MQAQFANNSVLVWKRIADENEQSAKLLTRISLALLLMMVATGGYAYSNHSKVSELCTTLAQKSATAESPAARKLGLETLSAYCR